MPKTFLVQASYIPYESAKDAALDQCARSEFVHLADTVRSDSGNDVECFDYASVDGDSRWFVRAVRRLGGAPAALALIVLLRTQNAEAIYTFSEAAALPLGLLLKLRLRRPVHVSVAVNLKKRETQFFYRWLGVGRQIDTLIAMCEAQRACATTELGVPADKVVVVNGFIDSRFYRPIDVEPEPAFTVASAGSTYRDYATLCQAAAGLPDVSFRVAPTGHPLRLGIMAIPDMPIPPNVDMVATRPGKLREFYAPFSVVAVPVHEGHTTAGSTTMLEAMAMEKAVIVTRSKGLADFVIDGETGLSVAPYDVEGWKAAIARLRDDPALRERLGRNARRWVERNSSLENWSQTIATALRPARVTAPALTAEARS